MAAYVIAEIEVTDPAKRKGACGALPASSPPRTRFQPGRITPQASRAPALPVGCVL